MKLIVTGNIASGKSTVAKKIAEKLDWQLVQIDSFRMKYGGKSSDEDFKAKKEFVSECSKRKNQVIEILGKGTTAYMLYAALQKHKCLIVQIVATKKTCASRYQNRKPHQFEVPNYDITCLGIINQYCYEEVEAIFSPIEAVRVNNFNGRNHADLINEIQTHIKRSLILKTKKVGSWPFSI